MIRRIAPVAFAAVTLAFAACGSGAARTSTRTPGAATTGRKPGGDATPAPEPIWRIVGFSFVSPTQGWLVRADGSAAGGGSQVLATLDGGDTWMRENTPATFAPATVHFVDAQHGWLAGSDSGGGSSVLSTVDGGMTWSPQPLPAGPVTALTFTDAQDGWALSGGLACGGQPTDCQPKPLQVMHTDDGGATWTSSIVAPPRTDHGGGEPQLSATDGLRGWVLTRAGAYFTDNAGAAWYMAGAPGSSTCRIPRQITMIDASVGWALCSGNAAEGLVSGGLYQTTDGARTWQLVSQFNFGAPTPAPGVGQLPGAGGHFQFLDETHGWLTTGDHGPNIYATSDGGYSWQPFTTSLSDSLEVLEFVDANHGWVANGTMLSRTIDGGQHWITLDLTPSSHVERRDVGPSGQPGPINVIVGDPPTTPEPNTTYGPFLILGAGVPDASTPISCDTPSVRASDPGVLSASPGFATVGYVPPGFTYAAPEVDFVCGGEARGLRWIFPGAGASEVRIFRGIASAPITVAAVARPGWEHGSVSGHPALFHKPDYGGPKVLYMFDGKVLTIIFADVSDFNEVIRVAESIH